MKKHLSLLLIATLLLSMLTPITAAYAEEDPNIQLYNAIKNSVLGEALQNTDVDSLKLIESIRTLQGTGFLTNLIDDLAIALNSEPENVEFKNFIKDYYGLDRANTEKFINILRNWMNVNDNDVDVFLSLFTKLKTGEDLDPVEDVDVLEYIQQLRETVAVEMSGVISKWNNEVLLDSSRKAEFILDLTDAVLYNTRVVKNSEGNLEFSIDDEGSLNYDIECIEDEYLQDGMPRLWEQGFDHIAVIYDCIPVIETAVQDAIDTTSLTVDDMVDLLQAFGVNYIDLQNPAEIESAYYRNYIGLDILLSDIPEEEPDASSVDIVRYIDGELDEEFEWHDGWSSWDEESKTLTIEELEYVPGAEYKVTFIGDSNINIVDVTQFNYKNLYIYFTKLPETHPTATTVNVTRTINGEIDEEFEWNGGSSSWDEETNLLTIYYLPYDVDGEIIYSVSYFDFEPVVADTEMPPMIRFISTDNGEIILWFDTNLKEELSPSDFTVTMTVNGGEPETVEILDVDSFDSGVFIRVPFIRASDVEQSVVYVISFKGLPEVTSEPFIVRANDSITIEEVSYKTLTDLEIVLSDIPSERPTATSVNIVRYIDGELDEEFEWYGGCSSWDEETRTLTIEELEYVPGAEYEVTFIDDPNITIEELTQIDYQVLDIALSDIPAEDPTALSIGLTRTINGEPDEEFVWSGGTSNWDDYDRTLRIYNLPLPEPTEEDQVVVYTVLYNDSVVELEPIIVPAESSDDSSGDTGNGGSSGGGSTGGSSGGGTEEPGEVTVPENQEEPVEGVIDEESVTVEEEDGVTTVTVEEEVIEELVDSIVEAVEESGQERETQVVVEVKDTDDANMTVSLPGSAISKLQENNVNLVIKSDNIEYNVPADTLAGEEIPEGAKIEFKSKELTEEEVKELEEVTKDAGKVAKVLELSLEITTDSETKAVTKFNNKLVIKVNVVGMGDKDKLGIYYVNDVTNKLEFVGGKVKDGKLVFKTNHYSKYAVVEADKTFEDVADNWAKYYIESMAAKHVIGGYEDGLFRPQNNVTRAEFAKMVVKALELDLIEYAGEFNDITGEEWYAGYVATAMAAGIIDGYPDGAFKPNREISREEMAKMISAAVEDVEVTEGDIEEVLALFTDEMDVSDWAKEYVAKAYKAQLMNGVKLDIFVPKGITTRAEAATAIYRLYNR